MSLGSWLRDHPRALERAYSLGDWLFKKLGPLIKNLGYQRVEILLKPLEEWSKKVAFDCQMCGQCILHSTGMTCPMTCPKNLRNGPCGGVMENGNCEVISDMRCIWVEAYERSQKMISGSDELMFIQPPLNRQLEDRSAWITILSMEDQQVLPGWE